MGCSVWCFQACQFPGLQKFPVPGKPPDTAPLGAQPLGERGSGPGSERQGDIMFEPSSDLLEGSQNRWPPLPLASAEE